LRSSGAVVAAPAPPKAPPCPLQRILSGTGLDPAARAGGPLPRAVATALRRGGEEAEALVCLFRLAAIALFGARYLASERQAVAGLAFEPVPWTPGAYLLLALGRLNIAARLEKHATVEAAPVAATAAVAARAQGWRPRLPARVRPGRAVEGLAAPAHLVVLGAPFSAPARPRIP
jgi:hypothetical protein